MSIAWLTVIPVSVLVLIVATIILRQKKSWKLKKEIKKTTLPLFSYILRGLSFCTSKKHVIPMLLRIELIILSLMAISIQIERRKASFILTILILMVGEGVTGLAIMLKSTKTKGNDLLSSSVI